MPFPMTSLISGRVKPIAFFVFIALFIAGGLYVYKRSGSRDISLVVNVPDGGVEAGVPFDIEVQFDNASPNILADTRFVLELGKHILYADGAEGVVTRELGDIKSGGSHRELFRVVAVPPGAGEEPDYKVQATAFYSPSSLVAEFRKRAEATVAVRTPAVSLAVSAPERVLPGEEFEVKMPYELMDELPEGVEIGIQLRAPDGFRLLSSAPESDNEGIWMLSDIQDKRRGEITVRGAIDANEGGRFVFTAAFLMQIQDTDFPFLERSVEVAVEPSPLAFNIVLAGGSEVVRAGESLQYTLRFRNNTQVDFQSIVIRAQLVGEMFDMASLETDGKVNRTTNTISWSAAEDSRLARLAPGEGGEVGFSVQVKDEFPIKQLNDKNFTLRVLGSIESPTVPYFVNASKTSNTSKHEAKVAGALLVDARALFRDAASGILNRGPFPPRAGRATNYTIHWSVTNVSTDVDAVEVRAPLPDGVQFTGVVQSNTESVPMLDAESREVVWQLGKLVATTGILSERPEAVFQIEATPSGSRIGEYLELLGTTVIQGVDTFTGETLTASDAALTSRLVDDLTVSEDDGRVRE